MSTTAKERVTHIEENLYHHGLAKIILVEVPRKQEKSLEDFLTENHFVNVGDSDSSGVREENPIEKPKKPQTNGPKVKEDDRDDEFMVTSETIVEDS